MSDEKDRRFFTFEKLKACILYDLIAIGILSSYLFFEIKIVGNDAVIGHVSHR